MPLPSRAPNAPLSPNAPTPVRFDYRWLIGPAALIVLAILIVIFIPSPAPAPAPFILPDQKPAPVDETPLLSVEQAKTIALTQCAQTYDCAQTDCLEKVLTHIDSATQKIQAVLRTPAPRVFRDHLRQAIKRGVHVQLILDSQLNPKFFLEGAEIHVKSVNHFVATNYVGVDDTSVIVGNDPQVYAQPPDIVKVECKESQKQLYSNLFDRLWKNESTAFDSKEKKEEVLADNELNVNASNGVCQDRQCPADTYYCDGTTKVWQHNFCLDNACAYQVLPLYYSADCGYTNPGFDPQGSPLIVMTETEFDERNPAHEFIEFTSLQSLELSNFTLLQNGVPLITFPSPFILDGAARVYTSSGTNTTSSVYLGSSSPLWSGGGVTATLVNPLGVPVVQRTFG